MNAATRNMLIIKDARGEIIGAQIEEPADAEIRIHIIPAGPQHTLHRVWDVPAEIYSVTHPDKFHRAIHDHIKSAQVRVTQIRADQIQADSSGLRNTPSNRTPGELASENAQLKKAVSELTLEKLALKEALEGKCQRE